MRDRDRRFLRRHVSPIPPGPRDDARRDHQFRRTGVGRGRADHRTSPAAASPAAAGRRRPLSWARLTPAQHAALAPFADQWDGFSDARKRKWLKIASRFAKLSPDDQKRLQERMTEWAKMTPEQRRVARENYQSAKELSAQARERAWKAYQQLPEEQKERLAAAERRRKPSVVSAPPTVADRDVRRLVNSHEHPASGAAAAPAPASAGVAAQPVPASSTSGTASAPAAVAPVSPADAPSLFKGS